MRAGAFAAPVRLTIIGMLFMCNVPLGFATWLQFGALKARRRDDGDRSSATASSSSPSWWKQWGCFSKRGQGVHAAAVEAAVGDRWAHPCKTARASAVAGGST